MNSIKNLQDLMLNEIQHIYKGKILLKSALPILKYNSKSYNLKSIFKNLYYHTYEELLTLEKIISRLKSDSSNRFKNNEIMESMLQRTLCLSVNCSDETKDAAILTCVQKILHLNIAGYGTVCAFANQIGKIDIAKTLHECLLAEKNFVQQLSLIAQTKVNKKAIPESTYNRPLIRKSNISISLS